MPSTPFLKGFRHELANRAFAYIAIGRMARRMSGQRSAAFWSTYFELEVFNQPRYEAAATRWGLSTSPGLGSRLKAWVVSSVPRPLSGLLLKVVLHETVKYLEWLRGVSSQGPLDARAFLEYMVAQEEMQIEMMRMALDGRELQIKCYAGRFFEAYKTRTDVFMSRPSE
jgi:hypothetical protein